MDASYRTGWCEVAGCRERIFIGVGLAPLWVCSRHFDLWQRGLERVEELFRSGGNP